MYSADSGTARFEHGLVFADCFGSRASSAHDEEGGGEEGDAALDLLRGAGRRLQEASRSWSHAR